MKFDLNELYQKDSLHSKQLHYDQRTNIFVKGGNGNCDCVQSDITVKSSLIFGTTSLKLQKDDYFQKECGKWCGIGDCTGLGLQSSGCLSLDLKLQSDGTLNSGGSSYDVSFNAQSNSCILIISCNYGSSSQYTIQAQITINPTSTGSCTYQNGYQLSSSDSLNFIYLKSSGQTSQTKSFIFDQSPSTICSFASCFFSDQNQANAYTDTSFVSSLQVVTLTISSQTFSFNIDKSSAHNKLILYIGCRVLQPPASQEFVVYSNQLEFLVCDYTKVSQQDRTLLIGQAANLQYSNELLKPSSSDCTLQSCNLYESASNTQKQNLVNYDSSSSTFSISFATSSIISASYYIRCNDILNSQQQSESFKVSVVCGPSSVTLTSLNYYNASFIIGTYSSVSFTNFTTSNSACPLKSHKICQQNNSGCIQTDFTISQSSGSRTFSLNYLSGNLSSYSYYILATADGGSTRSSPITITLTCGPSSVSISAPSAFRQTQSFQIGQQTALIYSNFTSNDTRCPIIKHSLAQSLSNESSPSQFSILEGNSQFKINYILNGGSPTLYTFFIKAQALGGATFYKKVFIQSLAYYDCSQDSIQMIQSMPDKSNANFKYYQLVDQYPVLKLNKSLGKSFSADISSNYRNSQGLNCPLKFNIQQVTSQDNVISSSDYSSIFKLSSSGTFQVQASADQAIDNYLVYVQVCNEKICFSDLKHYLIDVSLYKLAASNITFVAIKEGKNPYFEKQPQNITINVAKLFGNYIHYLPGVSNDTSNVQIMQTSPGQKIDILYNPNRLNVSLIFQQKSFLKNQDVFVLVRLKNKLGFTTDYNLTVQYIDFNPKNVSAKIKKINQIGLMTIYFNDSMTLNDSIAWIDYIKNETIQFNNSWINSTNTNIYLLPANSREKDSGFNKSSIEFNWEVISLTAFQIDIQLNFTYPLQISPQLTQDRIVVQFNGSQYLLMSQQTRQNLHPLFWMLSSPIMKQMTNDLSTQTYLSTIDKGETLVLCLLVLGFLFNLLGGRVLDYMRLMIRSLQLILHLPIMLVSLPANVIAYINDAISFVMFDVFFNNMVWSYLTFISFNNEIQIQALTQMQNVGYDYRNSFQGLAAITFFIFLYIIRLFISIVLIIVLKFVDRKKQFGNRIFQIYMIVSKGIFFNQIIVLSLEAYIELYINSLLNIQTADFSTNGELLGISLSYFTAIMIHGFLPVLMLFTITRKQKQLSNTSFSEYFGDLYEGTKIDTKLQLAYSLIFVLRRFIFCTIGMFLLNPNLGGMQIVLLMLLNVLSIAYIGCSSAQKRFELNMIEFVNEIFVQAATIHLVFFTDFVLDLDVQFMYGWLMIGCITFVFLFNFYFVFREIFKLQCKYIRKYYNLLQFYSGLNINSSNMPQALIEQNKQTIQQVFEKIIEKNNDNFQKNSQTQIKAKPLSTVQQLQGLNYSKINPKELAEMIGSQYKRKQKDLVQNENSNNSLLKDIGQSLTFNQDIQKSKLSDSQIEINFNILKQQRKTYQQKSQLKNNKKNQLTKVQLQEQRKQFLRYVRDQRLKNEINSQNETQNPNKQFHQLIRNYHYILKECSNKNNSLIDLEKDLMMYEIKDGDSVEVLATKEFQIKEFLYSLIHFKSNLKYPSLEYDKFEKDLSLFIEQQIQFN